MHEMSVASGLLDLVRDEMEKHHATRLLRVRVRYGALAGIVPESLAMAFEIQIEATPLAGAVLELVEEPVCLKCGTCHKEFSPPPIPTALISPCDHCGEAFGHAVLSGKAMYLDQLEVE
jgi:Zn finger protein HypA/HybF (possibly regulating hydrogenase expression)